MPTNYEKLCALGIQLKRSSGQVKTLCPQCSHNRKPANQKDVCLSVNIDSGAYQCHNCNWHGSVAYEQKPQKQYVKPVWQNVTQLPNDVVQYFATRKISQQTLINKRIAMGWEWMPQTQKQEYCMLFPYVRNGELVNIKYRTSAKQFKMVKDAELILYNVDAIKDSIETVIVEGECFPPSCELLTATGWKDIDKISPFDVVAQFNEDYTIEFVKPICKIEKEYSGDLIQLSNQQKFYSLTTPDHNLVFQNIKKTRWMKYSADSYPEGNLINRIASHNGHGIPLSDDQLKLFIAVSADFTFRERGDLYACFLKSRKTKRIEEILNALKIRFSNNKDSRGYDSVFIRKKDNPGFLKREFPHEWIYQSSQKQKELIISEILHWDGNSVPNRHQIEYSTKLISNAKFIQTIAHLCGYVSTIIPRQNSHGKWFKVSILFNKKHSSTQAIKKERIQFTGKVYCYQVPSGMLLTRQNDCISISGNCDALSFEEAGYPYCVSVPNGASKGNNNLQYLDNCISYFENKTKIYIGVDNDEPGRALQHELVRRLGAERCWIIDYGDCKDGNEYLVKYGAIALTDLLSKARAAHISGILEVSDITSAVYDLRENGLQPGLKVDIKSIDDYISFPDSYFTIVTGIPNHGKSPFLDFILERLVVLHNKKVAYCSPESEPTQLHLSGVISLITGKSFEKKFGIDKQITKEELAQALAYCQDHYYFISQEASESLNDLYLKKFTLDNVLALAKKLVFRYGINYLVIDPWNRLEHAKGNFWSETDYVSEQLDKVNSALKILGIHVFVIAHPTKLLKDKRTGQYEIPSLYSISGSAAFFSKPHMGWTSYRNFDLNEHWMVIQKMKHRHIGKIPNEDQVPKFYYDAVSGRFTPKGCQADHSNHLLTRPPALGYGVPQPEIFTSTDFNDAPPF